MKNLYLSIFFIFILILNGSSQEQISSNDRLVQITFGYPIGSNGIISPQYSNHFSLNILYGVNGGVKGCEIGSLLNYNKGMVSGFQLSGISNINIGKTKGGSISGITNIFTDSTSGISISGILNFSKSYMKGVQLGVGNISLQNMDGVQIGVINYGKTVKGFQLGVINLTHNMNGSQIGVVNYNSGMKGFQLGVINLGMKFKGIQLGVINIDNSDEGAIPIGLISIVKNGFYEFELTGGEAIFSNLNYKMGVERFYTLFKVGYTLFKSNEIYSYGMGFGSHISLNENQKISIDLSTNQIINNNNWGSGNLNMLHKLDINYKYYFLKRFSFLIGPSFNVYLTQEKTDEEFGTIPIPYNIFSREWNSSKLFMWIGVNAGLSVKL